MTVTWHTSDKNTKLEGTCLKWIVFVKNKYKNVHIRIFMNSSKMKSMVIDTAAHVQNNRNASKILKL